MRQMTPNQLQRYLNRADVSQNRAGPFLDVDPRTVRRWIAGQCPISGPAAKLLRVMMAKQWSAKDVDRILKRARLR